MEKKRKNKKPKEFSLSFIAENRSFSSQEQVNTLKKSLATWLMEDMYSKGYKPVSKPQVTKTDEADVYKMIILGIFVGKKKATEVINNELKK